MLKIIKTLRITAWILVFVTVVVLLSGFVMTKPFLSPFFGGLDAYYWHVVLTPLLFIPLVYIHSLMGMLLLFARHQKYNTIFLKSLALGSWTALFVLFIFMYTTAYPTVPAGGIKINNTVQTNTNVNTNIGANTNTNVSATAFTLTSAEVARHNTESDCWMIISGKVYNLSGYAMAHPGGTRTIDSYCGKEATSAFDTKGGQGRPHSGNAQQLLSSYYVGDLGVGITTKSVTSTPTAGVQTNTSNKPTAGSGEYDD